MCVLCVCVCVWCVPLSVGFPRPDYWSGLPFPSPGDLPNPGIKPVSIALQADSLSSELPNYGINGTGTINYANGKISTEFLYHSAHTKSLFI